MLCVFFTSQVIFAGRVSLLNIRTHTHGGLGGVSGEERFCACDVAFEPLSPDGLKLETEKHASVNSAKFSSEGEKKTSAMKGGPSYQTSLRGRTPIPWLCCALFYLAAGKTA